MAPVELRTVSKRFVRVTALDGISLAAGEAVVFTGPSGSGDLTRR